MEFWRLIWVGLGDVAHFVLVLAETAPPTVTKVVVEEALLLTDTVSFLRERPRPHFSNHKYMKMDNFF